MGERVGESGRRPLSQGEGVQATLRRAPDLAMMAWIVFLVEGLGFRGVGFGFGI